MYCHLATSETTRSHFLRCVPAGSRILARARSEHDICSMHSQPPNRIHPIRWPHHGAAVADQGASAPGQGHTVADQESTTNAPGTRAAVAAPEAEINAEGAHLERTLRVTPRQVPVEADCATLRESLDALQRIVNALDRAMQQRKCAQVELQLGLDEGRVEGIEFCQRFAEASDRIVSAGEAIFMVREIVPLLRHALEQEGR